MAAGGSTRLTRRTLIGVVALTALIGVAARPRLALAQDAANALRELGESPDFRVRVTAALYLGRTRPASARTVC